MFQIAPHRRSHRRERRKRAGAARKSDKEWAGRGRPATGLKYLMYQLEWVLGGQREFRPRPTSSAQRAPGWSADGQQTPFGPRRCGVYHGLAPSARAGEGQLMQRLEWCRMRWRQGKPLAALKCTSGLGAAARRATACSPTNPAAALEPECLVPSQASCAYLRFASLESLCHCDAHQRDPREADGEPASRRALNGTHPRRLHLRGGGRGRALRAARVIMQHLLLSSGGPAVARACYCYQRQTARARNDAETTCVPDARQGSSAGALVIGLRALASAMRN